MSKFYIVTHWEKWECETMEFCADNIDACRKFISERPERISAYKQGFTTYVCDAITNKIEELSND